MEVRNKMRKRLYRLVLVAVLGGSFALAQNSMPPTQQAPTSDQANTSASALKTQADIQTALAKDYSLATANVNVQVSNSGVELTGTVPSEDAKTKVEQIATAKAGGLPVKNNIKVVASSPK
jgi:osmotically-inducible protein OsmY